MVNNNLPSEMWKSLEKNFTVTYIMDDEHPPADEVGVPGGHLQVVDRHRLLGVVHDRAHGHRLPVRAQQLVAGHQLAGRRPGPVGPERVLRRGPHRVRAHAQLDQRIGRALQGLHHRP